METLYPSLERWLDFYPFCFDDVTRCEMFGLGPLEFILILVFALLIFGPKRLPELGKQIVETIREFRKVSRELEEQVREEFSETSVEEATAGGSKKRRKKRSGQKKDDLH